MPTPAGSAPARMSTDCTNGNSGETWSSGCSARAKLSILREGDGDLHIREFVVAVDVGGDREAANPHGHGQKNKAQNQTRKAVFCHAAGSGSLSTNVSTLSTPPPPART